MQRRVNAREAAALISSHNVNIIMRPRPSHRKKTHLHLTLHDKTVAVNNIKYFSGGEKSVPSFTDTHLIIRLSLYTCYPPQTRKSSAIEKEKRKDGVNIESAAIFSLLFFTGFRARLGNESVQVLFRVLCNFFFIYKETFSLHH